MIRTLIAPAFALALVAGSATASITGTTGSISQISAPASCIPGSLSPVNAWAWNEQTNVVATNVLADLTTNPSNSGTPVPGPVSGLFDSHFMEVSPVFAIGTVTFSDPIVAVLYNDSPLDLTDAQFGAGGTTYPTSTPFRGLNAFGFISINANVLSFNFQTVVPGVEQVRVLTKPVPTPGSLALLGLGGLIAARRRRA